MLNISRYAQTRGQFDRDLNRFMQTQKVQQNVAPSKLIDLAQLLLMLLCFMKTTFKLRNVDSPQVPCSPRRGEAGPQQGLVPGAGVPGSVQPSAEHRGRAHCCAVCRLPQCFLLRLQRDLDGRPRLPRAPAHDAALAAARKWVSRRLAVPQILSCRLVAELKALRACVWNIKLHCVYILYQDCI